MFTIDRHDILSNTLLEGEKIPTENDFIDLYNVSRVTVRKAISDLVEEGLLARHPSKGTFVSSTILQKELDVLASWTDSAEKMHYTPKTICDSLTIVSRDTIQYHSEVPISPHTQYVGISRTRYRNDVPVIYEINFQNMIL